MKISSCNEVQGAYIPIALASTGPFSVTKDPIHSSAIKLLKPAISLVARCVVLRSIFTCYKALLHSEVYFKYLADPTMS
jgi:hypothetical protein